MVTEGGVTLVTEGERLFGHFSGVTLVIEGGGGGGGGVTIRILIKSVGFKKK